MTFKFDQYNVLYNKTGLYNNDPATYHISVTDYLNIKTLGVINSDSFYKTEPKEVIIDSLGEEVILSYQAEAELNIENELTLQQLTDIQGELISIVLIPSSSVIDNSDPDLTGANLGSGTEVYVFKAATGKVFENKKIGSREINPTTIKIISIANTKEELIKKFTVI